jgi:glucokinase
LDKFNLISSKLYCNWNIYLLNCLSMTSDLAARAILELALVHGRLTVPHVVEELSIPATTALGVVHRLLERGVIQRGPDLPARRGRPIACYLPALPRAVIACQIDGSEVLAARVASDLSVGPIHRAALAAARQPEQFVAHVKSVVERAAADGEAARVALAVNAVEVNGRTLTSSVIPGINEIIRRLVDDELPQRRVELCLSPMMLAEYRNLADAPADPMLLLRVSDGVSSHAIVNRSIFHGASGLAGELGHVTVDPDNGLLCGCGRRGCLETLCSGPAIRNRLLDGLRQGVVSTSLPARRIETASPREAIDRAWDAWLAGDSFVRATMEGVLDHIAWGAGLAINLYDPRAVVMGGYVLKGRAEWIDEARRRSQRWTLHAGKRETRFVSASATDEDLCQLIALQSVHRDVLGAQDLPAADDGFPSGDEARRHLAQLIASGE